MKFFVKIIGLSLLTSVMSQMVQAHDPIFGLGPHVLFKDGIEIAADIESEKAGAEKEQVLALELAYGITGDWAIGVGIPYKFKQEAGVSTSGSGAIAFFTKYRFWREDSLALQRSSAVFLKVITNTADKKFSKGSSDMILGLTYGYEGRKWYRWASIRYRLNGTNNGIDRGDKILIDFVGGVRPDPRGYLESDTVWLLELNGEFGKKARSNGAIDANSGGNEWFISPGIFWTKRNFAVKAGLQIPILSDLNGTQDKSNYRAKVSFEWHI